METEKTLTQRIMAVTLEIQENYPELTKYMAEMTVTNPDEKDPDVNKIKLQEYYDSLIAMVKKYKESQLHPEDESNRH
jgi:hypothetical protein